MWGTFPAERVQGFLLSPYFHLLRDDKARAADDPLPPRAPAGGRRPSGAARGRGQGPAPASSWTPRPRATPFPWRRELRGARARPRPHVPAGRAPCCAPPTTRPSSRPTSTASTWWATPSCASPSPNASATCVPRRSAATAASSTATSPSWASGSSKPSGASAPTTCWWWSRPMGWSPCRSGGACSRPARERSGTHANAPDGLILAVGAGIRPGARLAGALRPRRGPDPPLPRRPSRGTRHGGTGPGRDGRRRRSRASTR